MNYDELEIIVKKNGTVEVRLGDEVKRLRYYKEIFEEVIGEVQNEVEIREGSPEPAKQVDKKQIRQKH